MVWLMVVAQRAIHASDGGPSNTLSVSETCSGQICNGVLGLALNRPDREMESLVAPLCIAPVRECARSLRFIDARSTRYVLAFDLLISSLRAFARNGRQWIYAWPVPQMAGRATPSQYR
jgi:hypothetical protein